MFKLIRVTEDNSDKDDGMKIGVGSTFHLHGDQQLVGHGDIIGIVAWEDKSDENEMEVAVSESQPPHVDQQLVSYLDSDSKREPCNSKQQPIFDKDFDDKIDLVLVSK